MANEGLFIDGGHPEEWQQPQWMLTPEERDVAWKSAKPNENEFDAVARAEAKKMGQYLVEWLDSHLINVGLESKLSMYRLLLVRDYHALRKKGYKWTYREYPCPNCLSMWDWK